MIFLSRTFDLEAVSAILRDPRLFGMLKEDSEVEPEDYTPPGVYEVDHYFLLARDNGVVVGVVIFAPLGEGEYDAHLNILPTHWGKGLGRIISLRALRWMFSFTNCHTVFAFIPKAEYCKPVLRVTLSCGFVEIGEAEGSPPTRILELTKKDFALGDQHELGFAERK